MSDRTKTPGADVYEQAVKSYEQALKTGVRVQEECAKWWTNVLNQTTRAQDWPKTVTSVLNEAFPVAQKNLEESLQLIEQNTRRSLELLKQATEAPQSTSVADGQARVQKLWQTSLELLQHNAQAMTQANARLVETLTQLARKNTGGSTVAAAK